jgi:prophage endopeptidase
MNRLLTEIIVVLTLCLLNIGGYFYGKHVGDKEGYQRSEDEVVQKIAENNTKSRKVENNLNQRVIDLSTELEKVKENAKKEIAKRNADIASSKLRLYVQTKSPVCPSKDASSTIGPDTATAQLDPAFAQSIVTITDDGDTAIRKLNACIATYNQVREMINGFTPTK